MTAYRVLIVDDQIEARHVFRSSVETIEEDIEVVDVPSGEEAFFEYSLEPFDLLIADVRLAGMTGLELMWLLKGVASELRVILVTGVKDQKVWQKVVDAGADFYFMKPIEISGFIDAVEKCLKATKKEEVAFKDKQIYPQHNLSDQMLNLRNDLDATAVMLLNEKGEVLAQTEHLPNGTKESKLIPALMAVFSAGVKVSHFLGAELPDNIFYSCGEKNDLFFAQMGKTYALLVAVNHHEDEKHLEKIVRSIRKKIPDINDSLTRLGIEHSPESVMLENQPELIDVVDEDLEGEVDSEFGKLLQSNDPGHLKGEDIEAFWASVTSEISDTTITNPDSISYDQARKLGLTPEDET